MKKNLFIFFVITIIQFSCSKSKCDIASKSIEGKWRMIMVKDNFSGSTISKHPSIQGDVDINFSILISSTKGTFDGKTPSNHIQQNEYTVGPNQSLTIPVLSMTKVGETSWGKEFVDNILSSQSYDLKKCYRLEIKTTNKTLTFQKI